ncbi:MAG: replicative DNA helicase [Candidatus Andersenbacteria bacterium RIFCSPHIGHO2_12_FULL_46_9]|nr:MAG: replicative DNA helicase [Candidatus Andersenbacteria bacterium RIFCSPHIGHO2_02_FULL_46_16]OGY35324.1 MAG: replicative DNA helicase [Candidatus Andersenbacteria bacterium RIFCSPHIGHO2_12_FULL_46_9]OGY36998.1 MAG: replicative DNA helicase [Candidatus Andersenbacteria bacterium RIFCSPLOWO2_02_FULL_46_11]HBE90293.1 replicative DNA helicase [Candidatus Andersenbacteria bacterium]
MSVNLGIRVPPHSYEAEESVLGCLLIDKDALVKVGDFLSADDFYKEANRKIYDICVELFNKGITIDVVSVVNRLKEKKLLVAVEGEAHIAHLATVVPTAGSVVHYARIVQKYGSLRRLITAAASINELGFNEANEIEQTLDDAERLLFGVSREHSYQQFSKISDALEAAFERIDKLHKGDKDLRGITTGIPQLDLKLAGWQKSDLIILAARPSMGKTALALDFARHAALSGVPVGIFSLEMSQEQLVDRMLAAHAHVDLWRMRTGKLETDGEYDDFSRLGEAMSELSEAPIYIDDHASNNVMGIRTMARRLQAEHGLGLLIIDYLQLMESNRYKDNRVQEVSDISRSLKKLALELNVPVLALSQLSRAVELRGDQRPRLSDLRESGSIEQDADVVLFIHRTTTDTDEQRYKTEVVDISLLIEKHRNGPTGEIPLRFHNKYVTMLPPENSYQDDLDGDVKNESIERVAV